MNFVHCKLGTINMLRLLDDTVTGKMIFILSKLDTTDKIDLNCVELS